jgi:hypothetical protein
VIAAVLANLRLVVVFCQRQAEQVGAAAEKASVGLGDKLFPPFCPFGSETPAGAPWLGCRPWGRCTIIKSCLANFH